MLAGTIPDVKPITLLAVPVPITSVALLQLIWSKLVFVWLICAVTPVIDAALIWLTACWSVRLGVVTILLLA